MKTLIAAFVASLSLTLGASADAADDAGRAAFREIYKEMVEIDSSQSTGSCTKVVRAAETRLRAAGFSQVRSLCTHSCLERAELCAETSVLQTLSAYLRGGAC